MKTLVVEAEFTSRIVLQKIFSGYGESHMAVNGEEAVAAFRMSLTMGAPYDLICMDICMSWFDGIEAVRRIRAVEEEDGVLSSNGTKILMITAMNHPKKVIDSFYALCDGYIVKPVDAADLRQNLRAMALIP
jgi:two-component system chemotaxis response regulator CheY